ncbi:MAG: lytic transglycosylase domain-containing protein [Opitutaceae bacterium]|nr:lytic transglycosylase domain-containing protein [Verrucomicrobiales bacterium]
MKRRWLIGFVLFLLLDVAVGVWWWRERRERSQDRVILNAARRYGMEPALVKAVVWRESWFDPAARGKVGELGLMQIREAAASEWATAEKVSGFQFLTLLDPGTNTLAGTWYLHHVLKRYGRTDNPVAFALADYNAGRGNVLKWMRGSATTNSAEFIDQIGFPGTKRYVEEILKRREKYRRAWPPS